MRPARPLSPRPRSTSQGLGPGAAAPLSRNAQGSASAPAMGAPRPAWSVLLSPDTSPRLRAPKAPNAPSPACGVRTAAGGAGCWLGTAWGDPRGWTGPVCPRAAWARAGGAGLRPSGLYSPARRAPRAPPQSHQQRGQPGPRPPPPVRNEQRRGTAAAGAQISSAPPTRTCVRPRPAQAH